MQNVFENCYNKLMSPNVHGHKHLPGMFCGHDNGRKYSNIDLGAPNLLESIFRGEEYF